MNDRTFLKTQTVELQRLLELCADDQILATQLRERVHDAERELDAASRIPGELFPSEAVTLPRAAVFLRGGSGVLDSAGIRPALAAEVLVQYENMFVEQALHDERLAAESAGRKRRPRGAANPTLFFTGTPRGSFGLEFVPQFRDDDSLLQIHAKSLASIADALIHVTESNEETLGNSVTVLPPRVLKPLKSFLRTLARYGAELRLAFPDRPSQSVSAAKLQSAAELLEREIEQTDITVEGVFRGVTLDSGDFNLKDDANNLYRGVVAESLSEDDLRRIAALLDQRCIAFMEQTTVHKVGAPAVTSYVLVNAAPSPDRSGRSSSSLP